MENHELISILKRFPDKAQVSVRKKDDDEQWVRLKLTVEYEQDENIKIYAEIKL